EPASRRSWKQNQPGDLAIAVDDLQMSFATLEREREVVHDDRGVGAQNVPPLATRGVPDLLNLLLADLRAEGLVGGSVDGGDVPGLQRTKHVGWSHWSLLFWAMAQVRERGAVRLAGLRGAVAHMTLESL